MEIKVLEFHPDEKGIRIGFVDFKVIYSLEKEETFRNISLLVKGDKRWLAMPKVKRDEKWLDLYERKPPIYNLLKDALPFVEKFIDSQDGVMKFRPTLQEDSLF